MDDDLADGLVDLAFTGPGGVILALIILSAFWIWVAMQSEEVKQNREQCIAQHYQWDDTERKCFETREITFQKE